MKSNQDPKYPASSWPRWKLKEAYADIMDEMNQSGGRLPKENIRIWNNDVKNVDVIAEMKFRKAVAKAMKFRKPTPTREKYYGF